MQIERDNKISLYHMLQTCRIPGSLTAERDMRASVSAVTSVSRAGPPTIFNRDSMPCFLQKISRKTSLLMCFWIAYIVFCSLDDVHLTVHS